MSHSPYSEGQEARVGHVIPTIAAASAGTPAVRPPVIAAPMIGR